MRSRPPLVTAGVCAVPLAEREGSGTHRGEAGGGSPGQERDVCVPLPVAVFLDKQPEEAQGPWPSV